MTNISAYDEEAKRVEDIAEKNDTTECEVIRALFDVLEDNDINIEDYL